MAMAFAFLSLTLILSLAYALDHSLATNSIILIGVIFSMFVSSVINLILSFVNDQVRSIAFWTMGSLSGTGYPHTRILSLALLLCGGVIVRHARELNAFAIGEDNARHVGVNVRRVKLAVLVTVSVLIGVWRVDQRQHRICRAGRAARGADDRRAEPQAAAPRFDVRGGDLSAAGRI